MNLVRRSWGILLLWLGCLLLALALPGEADRGNIFLSLTYLCSILLLVAFLWARFSLAGISLSRQLRSARSQVGKYAEEQLTLANNGPLPKLWLEVQDESELPQHRVSRVVNALSVGQQRSWLVRTPCLRRGSFRLGPVTLLSGDPFGIFRWQRQLTLGGTLVGYPPTYPLPGFAPAIGQLQGGETHRRRTHHETRGLEAPAFRRGEERPRFVESLFVFFP